MEFKEQDFAVFDEIMAVLKCYPDIEKLHLDDEKVTILSGLEICPERRKIYSNSHEISMTKKEFDIFYLLAVNKGRVLAYEQIYQSV